MTRHPLTLVRTKRAESAHNARTDSAAPTIADVYAEVRQLREIVERLVPRPREWLTVAEAAQLVGRTPAAIRARARVRPIGVKADGVWKIDRAALLKAT